MNDDEGVLFVDLVAATINNATVFAVEYDTLVESLYGSSHLNKITNLMVRNSGVFPYSEVYVDSIAPFDRSETAIEST